MADAVTELVGLLNGEGFADGRVFGGRLPESEQDSMPRECVIVRAAGGQPAGGYMTTTAERVDVRVYGTTEYEAHQLQQAVSIFLHGITNGHSTSPIRWARREGGPTPVTDPSDHWPFELSSWLVYGPWLEPDD